MSYRQLLQLPDATRLRLCALHKPCVAALCCGSRVSSTTPSQRQPGSVALSNFCQKMALILLNNFCWELLNATEPAAALIPPRRVILPVPASSSARFSPWRPFSSGALAEKKVSWHACIISYRPGRAMKPGQEAATSPYKSSRWMRAVSSSSGSIPCSDACAGTMAADLS